MKILPKALIVVSSLLFSLSGIAAPVIVSGVGPTREAAIKDGFRRAIENQLGTLAISDMEAKGDTLTKDDLLTYSAGYVDGYSIIDTKQGKNNTVVVTMKVEVSSSLLADRAVARGTNAKKVDGDRLGVQISSYMEERDSAQKVWKKHLSRYPSEAYKAKITKYEVVDTRGLDSYNKETFGTITSNANKRVSFDIYYQLSLEQSWVKGLNEILIKAREGTMKSDKTKHAVLIRTDPNAFLEFNQWDYHFFAGNNTELVNLLSNRLMTNHPFLKLSLNDNQGVMFETCNPIDRKNVRFYQNTVFKDLPAIVLRPEKVETVKISLLMSEQESSKLKYITEVVVKVVDESECN